MASTPRLPNTCTPSKNFSAWTSKTRRIPLTPDPRRFRRNLIPLVEHPHLFVRHLPPFFSRDLFHPRRPKLVRRRPVPLRKWLRVLRLARRRPRHRLPRLANPLQTPRWPGDLLLPHASDLHRPRPRPHEPRHPRHGPPRNPLPPLRRRPASGRHRRPRDRLWPPRQKIKSPPLAPHRRLLGLALARRHAHRRHHRPGRFLPARRSLG